MLLKTVQTLLISVLIPLVYVWGSQDKRDPSSRTGPPLERYEQVFEQGDNPTLILDNSSIYGAIDVQTWNRPQVKVTADIFASGTSVKAATSSGVLKVKLIRRGVISMDPVHFRVWAPQTCEIHLSSVSGKISITGIQARLKASTADGDIELIDVAGNTVDANSSTSGNVALTTSINGQGKYHLFSGTGQIKVTFKEPASFTLDAATDGGSIQLDGFTLGNESRSDRHVTGTYGNAQAILMLRTVRGAIVVSRQ